MSDLAAVLARLALDDVFREVVFAHPERALSAYQLTSDERAALSRPGPDWLGLLARAIRATEVPPGPAWAPPAADGGPVPTPPPPSAGPADASVWLRVGERRTEAGPAWEVQLLGQRPPPGAGVVDVEVALRMLGDQVSVTLRPGVAPEDDTAPVARWGHRAPTAAGWAVLEAEPARREESLLQLLRALRDSDSAPGPPPPPVAPGGPHVTVVGLGITGIEHVTRETEAVIRRASRVYHVDAGLAVPAWLRAIHKDVRPLFGEMYVVGEPRLAIYDRIAAEVLAGALQVGPVVLAVHGHPMFFSYVPALLLDAAPLVGLEARVLPGISADAVLFADLGIDPADHGLQAFEATDLLLRRRPVQNDVTLVVWQVGNLETRLHQAGRSRPERLLGLVAWLSEFYPQEHPVTAAFVSPHPGVPGFRRTVKLRDLPLIAADLHAAVTLVVPPVRRRPIADSRLASLVDDEAHAAGILESAPPDVSAR